MRFSLLDISIDIPFTKRCNRTDGEIIGPKRTTGGNVSGKLDENAGKRKFNFKIY